MSSPSSSSSESRIERNRRRSKGYVPFKDKQYTYSTWFFILSDRFGDWAGNMGWRWWLSVFASLSLLIALVGAYQGDVYYSLMAIPAIAIAVLLYYRREEWYKVVLHLMFSIIVLLLDFGFAFRFFFGATS